MTKDTFVDEIIRIARKMGFAIEDSRNGRQINFGHKKLHEGHLRRLYLYALDDKNDLKDLLEDVAPGRPCSHAPMKLIIGELLKSKK